MSEDTSMFKIISIIAILFSPIIAITIGELLRKRNFKKQKRLEVLNDLMMNRDRLASVESLRALNSLKLFFKDKKLSNLLGELHTAFCKRDEGNLESEVADKLIVRIIKRVCYLDGFKHITEQDIKNLFRER